ncbi:hypothetical protein QNH39_18575 [Neobacillus novalis]|uniref:DUF5658 domain-containing protein n=1 Tax=Neobacillus novalis TaxID=220687 RepID=A0AA95S9U2_9BACI|nr:hypothetical protein [Neobacillus novalis]WHY84644.1 hypothetical protein QNH39_18575 [Neobacillus novalis]
MNNLKFFIYQVILTYMGIANDIVFREYVYDPTFSINNRLLPALFESSINLVILFFVFKLYFSLKTTKLRYKIILHIAAFIVGAIVLALTMGVIVHMN